MSGQYQKLYRFNVFLDWRQRYGISKHLIHPIQIVSLIQHCRLMTIAKLLFLWSIKITAKRVFVFESNPDLITVFVAKIITKQKTGLALS